MVELAQQGDQLAGQATDQDDAATPEGVFVTFEGGDGVGKSTQVALTADWLRGAGRAALCTREPGGTALGGRIRDLLLHGGDLSARSEALLFAADRAHHIASLVRPALESGTVVIQDRYIDSSVAYQGAGRALDDTQIRELSDWATEGLQPDVTVLLDLPAAVGRARRGHLPDRLEREADEFHERVRDRFLDMAASDPERYLVIDATRPAEEIQQQIRRRLAPLVGVTA